MVFRSGASRLGGRVCARALIKGLTLLVFAIVAIGAPRDAEAKAYRWKDVNGNWDVAANWEPLDGGSSFPKDPGDEAYFTRVYSDKRIVTIPAGVTVSVAKIVSSDRSITINGTGKLRIDAGFQVPEIWRLAPAPPQDGSDVIATAVELRGSPDIKMPPASGLIFNGIISNNLCACGLTLKSGGKLYLRGPNTYLGTTSVEMGQLFLDFQDNVAKIQGNLEIGTGQPGAVVAEVLVTKHHQIGDTSRVLVKSQGLLTMDANDFVGETIVNEGFITIRTDAGYFAPASLNMTGGVIESRTNGKLLLQGTLTATSSANAEARIIRGSGAGVLDLGDAGDFFVVNDGPSPIFDLTVDLPIVGTGNVGINKTGNGTLMLREVNTYSGATTVQSGKLWLEPPANLPAIAGTLSIGSASPAVVEVRRPNSISDTSAVIVGLNGSLWINTTTPEVIGKLYVRKGANVKVGNFTQGAKLVTPALEMEGGSIEMFMPQNTLEVTTTLDVDTVSEETASISDGTLVLGGTRTLDVSNGPAPVDLRISSKITGGAAAGLKKQGDGTAVLSGANAYGAPTAITPLGLLIVNGQQPASAIAMIGGRLGGTGKVGPITATDASIVPGPEPGTSFGRLSSGSVSFVPATIFLVDLNGDNPNNSDQLAVTGTVDLGGAKLELKLPPMLPRDASFTIIDNDGVDPVMGTFFERQEGREYLLGGNRFRLTYRGGDGNDVVIEPLIPPTYYLAEGATGDFFDDDVLIANPNNAEAPVTLTFLREGGATVVVQRVIPARSRVTIHVDQIEGLEDASASVKVVSTNFLQLVVERTMFWDASYYGGHTANAVARPEKQWIFAEGFQGFFDTYLLIANANAVKTTATLTFLRENDTPVVKTVDVDPFQRKTVYAGEFDELKGRAFGIVVDATEPVIAERSMYFATVGPKLWSGGHVNTGIVAPSTSWFHAEGATGTFFKTFILLSNPQTTEAAVDVKFLLADGTVIERKKTLAPQQRLTINPAAEGDSRLENAAMSTVVQSSVPIVSERSMYWEGDVLGALGEGHNSSGVASTGIRWGLSEGRVGGPRNFVTYILLANPSNTPAKVRVSYLRENGAPIVKEYNVPATSRFNIDVKAMVPELEGLSFGADIEVLNDVPIAVERSLYWDAIGLFWSGGTNALATALRPAA
jgi:autotransporter-associated beta strand protein